MEGKPTFCQKKMHYHCVSVTEADNPHRQRVLDFGKAFLSSKSSVWEASNITAACISPTEILISVVLGRGGLHRDLSGCNEQSGRESNITLHPWFLMCAPQTSSNGVTWDLVSDAHSWVPPRPAESETLEWGPPSGLTSPLGESDVCSGWLGHGSGR